MSPDTWSGEWTEHQRQQFITNFNELLVNDVMQQEATCIDSNQLEGEDNVQEFKEGPGIVEEKLEEKRGYSLELKKLRYH